MGRGFNSVFEKLRVCSFSSELENYYGKHYPDENTLMWSHYACKHTGMCVEYKFEKPENIKEKFKNTIGLYSVLYKNYFIIDDAKNFFITKKEDWHYENEWRIVYYYTKEKKDCFLNLNDFGLTIKSITFGCRTSEEDKILVKNICKNMDITFYTMKKEDSDMSLKRVREKSLKEKSF